MLHSNVDQPKTSFIISLQTGKQIMGVAIGTGKSIITSICWICSSLAHHLQQFWLQVYGGSCFVFLLTSAWLWTKTEITQLFACEGRASRNWSICSLHTFHYYYASVWWLFSWMLSVKKYMYDNPLVPMPLWIDAGGHNTILSNWRRGKFIEW